MQNGPKIKAYAKFWHYWILANFSQNIVFRRNVTLLVKRRGEKKEELLNFFCRSLAQLNLVDWMCMQSRMVFWGRIWLCGYCEWILSKFLLCWFECHFDLIWLCRVVSYFRACLRPVCVCANVFNRWKFGSIKNPFYRKTVLGKKWIIEIFKTKELVGCLGYFYWNGRGLMYHNFILITDKLDCFI